MLYALLFFKISNSHPYFFIIVSPQQNLDKYCNISMTSCVFSTLIYESCEYTETQRVFMNTQLVVKNKEKLYSYTKKHVRIASNITDTQYTTATTD